MATNFKQKDKSKKSFSKIAKQFPFTYRKASTLFLNDLAYGTRETSKDVVSDTMTVRNERFLNAVLKVDRADFRAPIASKRAMVGSIRKDRFSGWTEQIGKGGAPRTRVASLLARNGDKKNPIAAGARMKPSKSFPDPSQYVGNSWERRSSNMIRKLKREKYKKPFIIKGHRKFKPGLYKLEGRKIRMLQDFSPKPKLRKPKRNLWHKKAFARHISANPNRATWRKIIKREIAKI